MKVIFQPERVFISSANVDMRNGIDGLAAVVQQKFQLDVFDDAMFVFHNRHCDKIKVLYWDGSGFCLLYKRIERGRFHFPSVLNSNKYAVSCEEFEWLLNGLRIEEIHRYETMKRA